jgi:hypothetical protein
MPLFALHFPLRLSLVNICYYGELGEVLFVAD